MTAPTRCKRTASPAANESGASRAGTARPLCEQRRNCRVTHRIRCRAARVRGSKSPCYHPAHAKSVTARDGRGRRGHGAGPGPGRPRLDGDRRRNPQALPGDRPDRLDRPADDTAGRGEAGRRLPPHGARGRRHPDPDLRRRGEPAQPRGPAQGQRQEASAAADGAHRHGEHRRRQVDPPAVQRAAPGRLHLRPRHRRRQGQRRRHGDDAAAAQAPERAARPRRHRPLRGRRGRRGALRHPVHGRQAPRPRSNRSSAWPRAAASTARAARSPSPRSRRSRRFPAPSR